MPCYHPITAWRSKRLNANGKRPLVFNRKNGYEDMQLEVPCGRCIGCKLERSRQWATRCMHEASKHAENAFLTLTYDEDNLPQDLSLDITHFQKFMKRYRKILGDQKIRFFHCGEYGEISQRPHYHALIFGHKFKDLDLIRGGDTPLYRSDQLSQLWPYGLSSIGEVTFQSAAYVARYVTKKITGEKAVEHYDGRKPEYCSMSQGIGKKWIQEYMDDVFPRDYVVTNEHPAKPPRYYSEQLKKKDPEAHDRLMAIRSGQADKKSLHPDSSYRRLYDREKCKKAQLEQCKRNLN
jgi:hypothetical protein